MQRTKPIRVTDSGREVLRLARQIDALSRDTVRELGLENGSGMFARVSIAVNADSLSTWVLGALAEFTQEVGFYFHLDDQDHTTELLRDGSVMAAVTSVASPIQGCTSSRLGIMRYRPMASAEFAVVGSQMVSRPNPFRRHRWLCSIARIYCRTATSIKRSATPRSAPSSCSFIGRLRGRRQAGIRLGIDTGPAARRRRSLRRADRIRSGLRGRRSAVLAAVETVVTCLAPDLRGGDQTRPRGVASAVELMCAARAVLCSGGVVLREQRTWTS